MKRFISVATSTIMIFLILVSPAYCSQKIIKMSTTTSTQASGLLGVLLPEFTKDTGIMVKVIAKGTGAALRDGMDGNVDVIFVHAKAREEAFIKEGYGTKRYAVMHNDFVILGPSDDPAGIKSTDTIVAALKKIAEKEVLFVSRGDDSGTHTKEQQLWQASGLPLEKGSQTIIKKGKKKAIEYIYPSGSKKWYLSIGQGMGKALTLADEKNAYIMADRGTFIKYKYGRDLPIRLQILFDGDPNLINPYGVIPINKKKHPHVKNEMAAQFAQWLVSSRGQALIAGYRLHGQQLFYPDAVK